MKEKTHSTIRRPLAAVILAAGKGTRMKGDRPKVLLEVAGRPMVAWVVRAARQAGARPIVMVVGHGADSVCEAFRGDASDLVWAVQERQLGTGHAAACAAPALASFKGDVLVLAGDGPLIRAETIRALVDRHRLTGAAATLAAAVIGDATGYGRIIRNGNGRFKAIVEDRNATAEERRVREIYPSYACFDSALQLATLERLAADEASGEYLITDVPRLLAAGGHRVEILDGFPPEDVLSINTPGQLAEVDAILAGRLENAR